MLPPAHAYELDERQNMYSYVTTGATTGFGGEIMGLEPLWL
jgi:hypothetical protein